MEAYRREPWFRDPYAQRPPQDEPRCDEMEAYRREPWFRDPYAQRPPQPETRSEVMEAYRRDPPFRDPHARPGHETRYEEVDAYRREPPFRDPDVRRPPEYEPDPRYQPARRYTYAPRPAAARSLPRPGSNAGRYVRFCVVAVAMAGAAAVGAAYLPILDKLEALPNVNALLALARDIWGHLLQ
jgi:hypothetical protein